MEDIDVVITNTALERARALHPPLAMQGDPQARSALVAMVAAGVRENCPDHRNGEAQELVALGAGGAAWGFAVCKDALVVTIVDPDGRRYLLARARRPAVPPRLRRVEAQGAELARYAVVGVPAVSALTVAPDGAVSLLGARGELLR